MYLKRRVKFFLHKRKTGETRSLAIRMRVTLKGERPFDFSLGFNVDLDNWDAGAERVIETGTPEQQRQAREANRTIEEYKTKINEIFDRYELLEKRRHEKSI